jgi:hypothetical protein
MSLDLNPEQERIVDHAIRAGLIRGPKDVIAVGIGVLRERLEAQPVPHSDAAEDEWERELHDWIHSHPSAGPVLSDDAVERESIYGSRGL